MRSEALLSCFTLKTWITPNWLLLFCLNKCFFFFAEGRILFPVGSRVVGGCLHRRVFYSKHLELRSGSENARGHTANKNAVLLAGATAGKPEGSRTFSSSNSKVLTWMFPIDFVYLSIHKLGSRRGCPGARRPKQLSLCWNISRGRRRRSGTNSVGVISRSANAQISTDGRAPKKAHAHERDETFQLANRSFKQLGERRRRGGG